jgi:hypothetical protein
MQALGVKPKAPKQLKQPQLDQQDMQKLMQGTGGWAGWRCLHLLVDTFENTHIASSRALYLSLCARDLGEPEPEPLLCQEWLSSALSPVVQLHWQTDGQLLCRVNLGVWPLSHTQKSGR